MDRKDASRRAAATPASSRSFDGVLCTSLERCSLCIFNAISPCPFWPSNYFHRSVIVAMSVVRMVQMTVDQIVDVIAMRNCFVSTIRAMHMTGVVSAATACAAIRIGLIHR